MANDEAQTEVDAGNAEAMRLDLHMHSHHSADSIIKPETMLKIAKGLGIGIAITDHGTDAAWSEFQALNKKYNIPIIYGEEILTLSNGEHAGELLGLFMQQGIKPAEYSSVIDEIKSQDALLVVPHPFDVFRANFKHLDSIRKKVDLLEVYNARCYSEAFNRKAEGYASRYRLAASAGSDAHTPGEIGRAYLELEATELEEARRKISKGEARAFGKSSGIFVHLKTALAKRGLIRGLMARK